MLKGPHHLQVFQPCISFSTQRQFQLLHSLQKYKKIKIKTVYIRYYLHALKGVDAIFRKNRASLLYIITQ
jgi:hypothetical protein